MISGNREPDKQRLARAERKRLRRRMRNMINNMPTFKEAFK